MDDLLGGNLGSMLAGIFERMEWAEDEIAKARKRHPGHAGRIWHSFKLMTPTHDLMATEMVYRSHVRELLARVMAGEDTRPGTAAEVCCACSDTSQIAPFTDSAAGLYGRMWKAAGFPGDHWDDMQPHQEALHASGIDDLERDLRRKLRVPGRVFGVDDDGKALVCGGKHHGKEVSCEFARPAKPEQLTLDTAAA
jgi:hypothetical protein